MPASKLFEDLARQRDELRLKMHLASRELQDEWAELERRWKGFESKTQLDRSASDVGAALEMLGSELKRAYERLNKAF